MSVCTLSFLGKVTNPTAEKTCAAAYISTLLQAAIMIIPITQSTTVNVSPCGRPQVSRILARGSLESPPMTLDIMPTVGVRECFWKELVTKGFRARRTTSCVDVMKYMSQILDLISLNIYGM